MRLSVILNILLTCALGGAIASIHYRQNIQDKAQAMFFNDMAVAMLRYDSHAIDMDRFSKTTEDQARALIIASSQILQLNKEKEATLELANQLRVQNDDLKDQFIYKDKRIKMLEYACRNYSKALKALQPEPPLVDPPPKPTPAPRTT